MLVSELTEYQDFCFSGVFGKFFSFFVINPVYRNRVSDFRFFRKYHYFFYDVAAQVKASHSICILSLCDHAGEKITAEGVCPSTTLCARIYYCEFLTTFS